MSPETVSKFREQLDDRRRKRVKRAKEEKRRDKRIQIENNKLLGKYPEAKLRIESEYHFPDVNRSSFSSSALSLNPRRSSESDNSLFSTSPSSEVLNEGNQPSFARMLREGVARPSQPQNAWMKKSETFPALSSTSHMVDSDPEPEGYVPPPPQASIGDALALALEKASLKGNSENKSGKKKGKKNKGIKIILGGPPRPEV